jgi:curved DNA-binding protein CbpA
VSTQQLLLEASRHIDLKFSAARLTNGAETLSPATAVTDDLKLLPAEAFLLSRIDSSISVDDLIALSGLPDTQARQAIYGLFLAGLLKREFWQPAFRTAPPQTAAPAGSERMKPKPVKKVLPPPVPEPKIDPRRELDNFLARLADAANHYEVLDVSVNADVTEIKRSYHTIAKNFHPDRFHDLAGTSTHTQLQSSFARITQAYETLINPEARAAHDGNLQVLRRVRDNQDMMSRSTANRDRSQGESESGDSLAQLAEKRFQEGAAALQLGHTNAAASCFSAAARMVPNEARYRAYFGRVLAANPKTRREAENELLAAVKLDPGNAQYHVMLAVLYRDLGFGKRAASQVEKALALDPNNSQARQLLASLEK